MVRRLPVFTVLIYTPGNTRITVFIAVWIIVRFEPFFTTEIPHQEGGRPTQWSFRTTESPKRGTVGVYFCAITLS